MNRFLVITDSVTSLRVRTGPGTEFPQVDSLPVESVVTSLENREIPRTGSSPGVSWGFTGFEVWHRIGTNRWVNELIHINNNNANITRNMVPFTLVHKQGRINAGTNIRRGPGLGFNGAVNRAQRNITMTHSVPSLSGICTLGSGSWFRIGRYEWVHSSVVV